MLGRCPAQRGHSFSAAHSASGPPRPRYNCSRKFVKQQRYIVTLSVEAPTVSSDPKYQERPGSLILSESALYRNPWSGHFSRAFPRRGVHFVGVDLFSGLQPDQKLGNLPLLSLLEENLKVDIGQLPFPLLVARGPVLSLVAQYYLESLPLSGLVLIDPLILPDHERFPNSVGQMKQSATKMLEMLQNQTSGLPFRDRISLTDKNDVRAELAAINELATGTTWNRPLRLEPGTVPMMVLSTVGKGVYPEDFFRKCSYETQKFHSPQDKTNGRWGDVLAKDISEENGENLDHVVDTIFHWIDDYVW